MMGERFLADLNEMRHDWTVRVPTRRTPSRIPQPGAPVLIVDIADGPDDSEWNAEVIAVGEKSITVRILGRTDETTDS